MFEFIIGIFGNIIASLIYDNAIRKPDAKTPPLVLIVQQATHVTNQQRKAIKFDQRALNREKARRTIALLLFFSLTLVFLKYAIFLPVFIGHSSTELDFSKVKLLNWFTDVSIPMSVINTGTMIIAILIYTPLLILGDRLLLEIQKLYDMFWEVTFDRWIGLRTLSFVFLSLLISGAVTYLVTELSLLKAIAIPFAVMIFLFLYLSSNSRR